MRVLCTPVPNSCRFSAVFSVVQWEGEGAGVYDQ